MPQYNTRIQLKSDVEANWLLVPNFVPLAGELIIYSPDGTHGYCRLKVGDGSTSISNLQFIDAGTINGHDTEIVKLSTINDRPQPGSPDKLYIDLSTNKIYHYDAHSGYSQLANFTFTTKDVSKITSWKPGITTDVSVNQNILKIKNGSLPELLYYDTEVLGSVQQG